MSDDPDDHIIFITLPTRTHIKGGRIVTEYPFRVQALSNFKENE